MAKPKSVVKLVLKDPLTGYIYSPAHFANVSGRAKMWIGLSDIALKDCRQYIVRSYAFKKTVY